MSDNPEQIKEPQLVTTEFDHDDQIELVDSDNAVEVVDLASSDNAGLAPPA